MKALQIFIFGNIYISLCAVLMVTYTNHIFNLNTNTDLLLFIFFATLTSYSFHWYLTPDVHSNSERYIWVNNNKSLLLGLFLLSSVFSLIFILPFKDHIITIAVIAFLTFLYSASKIPYKPFEFFKKVIIGKTAYLALVWTFVTVILPVIVSGKIWDTENTLFSVNRFLLIYPICILFDYRDKDEDREQHINNIMSLLSLDSIKKLFYLFVTAFMISSLIFFQYNFSFLQVIIILIPGMFLLFSFNHSILTKSDYWFYFYLDGLMMLSAVLSFIKNLLR